MTLMSGAMRRSPRHINSNDRPNAGHREWKTKDVTNETRMLDHERHYQAKGVGDDGTTRTVDAELVHEHSRAHFCAGSSNRGRSS